MRQAFAGGRLDVAPIFTPGRYWVPVSARATAAPRAALVEAASATKAKSGRLGGALFAIAVLSVLLLGWLNRGGEWTTPKMGLGYWLGITGSLMILSLVLYPLRKQFRALAWMGQVRSVFRLHMIIGVLGPTLVVLHSNFHLGSLNSTMALSAMLTVVASGVVGRYLYGHIHTTLHGRKAELRDLVNDAAALKAILGHDVEEAPLVLEALRAFEAEALSPVGPLKALWMGAITRRGRKFLSQLVLPLIERQAAQGRWPAALRQDRREAALLHLGRYLAAIRKASAFAFYERTFAAWHMLHMPMFCLLVCIVIVHILAVHLY